MPSLMHNMLHMWPAHQHAGETLSFAEVSEAARQLQHTAVGYLLASGQLAMVLEPLTQHTFQEGDQIVLITTGPRG